MVDVGSYAIKVLIIFIFTYFGARLLSKKAIAEMTAYEVAGIILFTTVAAEPLVTKVTTKAMFGTGIIILLIYLTSRLSLVNQLAPILEHTPTVVVRNGEVDIQGLKSVELSLNELYGLLREKGYNSVSDVEFVLLEPQGSLSVTPKSQKRPIQPSDLNVATNYEGLTLPLVMDGGIIEQNLRHAKLGKEWLVNALKAQGITDITSQVVVAELDTQGNLIVSKKINKN
ncbi:MAG: DUF421 domain-containing protein [Bacillota bacterium]|nr:DUF421 domain-containing protein [Bacillota bacterium]